MHFNLARALALTIAAILTGCTTHTTEPLAENQARISLETRPADQLSAYRLNGELVRGLRFPDLSPGEHSLQVRFRYERPGSGQAGSLFGDPQWRTCILGLEYNDFRGGAEYRLYAEQRGQRSIGWLESVDGERLARAEIIRCGPAA